MATVVTSGQVAKIAGVAERTACNWFDRKLVKGYYLPTDAMKRKRRMFILRDVIRLLLENKYPVRTILGNSDGRLHDLVRQELDTFNAKKTNGSGQTDLRQVEGSPA